MTFPTFIKDAVKGGYVLGGMDEARTKKDGYAHKHQILLDPLAWKAVGKVEGWGGNTECNKCGKNFNGWKGKMTGFMDAICDGKTIEQYLETL